MPMRTFSCSVIVLNVRNGYPNRVGMCTAVTKLKQIDGGDALALCVDA